MIVRSLKWQIQAWHTLLLVLIVGGLLIAFYFYERRVQVNMLDDRVRAPIHRLLPFFDLPRGVVDLREAEAERMDARQDRGAAGVGGSQGERRPPRFRGEQGYGGDADFASPRGGGPPRRNGLPGGYRSEGPGIFGGRDRPQAGDFQRNREEMNGERAPRANGGSYRSGATGRLINEGSETLERYERNGFYIVYWRAGEVLYKTEDCPESSPPSNTGVEQVSRVSGEERVGGSIYRWNGKYREFLQHTPRGWLLIGISTDVVDEHMAVFKWKLVGVGLAVIVFGVIVGWFMAGRAIKPIASMSSTASKIAGGDLSQRIDETNTKNELGQLAHVLNDTFGRLDSAFEQQVRFTADASHEMRTPLAVILAKSELALVRERTPEKYRETIKICHDSAQHMSGLIESLLELARVDSGEFKVRREQGNLGLEVNACVDMLRPLAEQKGIRVEADIQGVEMDFDTQRIRQVIINLLSNAVKYNRENGSVFVRVHKETDEVVVSVKDTGPGIKPDDLKHIFDRFYRVDKSRDSKQGSTGLGLAISQAIVKAHDGRLEAESVYGRGSIFKVVLPLS